MSVMRLNAPEVSGDRAHPGDPRVRDLAREAMVVMAFSAAVSLGVAVLLLVAYGLGR